VQGGNHGKNGACHCGSLSAIVPGAKEVTTPAAMCELQKSGAEVRIRLNAVCARI
jgi:hypothetical protein